MARKPAKSEACKTRATFSHESNPHSQAVDHALGSPGHSASGLAIALHARAPAPHQRLQLRQVGQGVLHPTFGERPTRRRG